jgi:hypothetical protein
MVMIAEKCHNGRDSFVPRFNTNNCKCGITIPLINVNYPEDKCPSLESCLVLSLDGLKVAANDLFFF